MSMIKTVSPSLPGDQDTQGRSKVEGMLQLNLLQALGIKDKEIQKSHFLQLIKVQGQVADLQRQRTADQARVTSLGKELAATYRTVADVKGHVARLTVEMACLETNIDRAAPSNLSLPPETAQAWQQGARAMGGNPPADSDKSAKAEATEPSPQETTRSAKSTQTSPEVEAKPKVGAQVTKLEADPVAASGFSLMDRLLGAGGNLEVLADEMLREHRGALVQALRTCPIGGNLRVELVIHKDEAMCD
ncbi:hypothetical protein HIM_08322 [Hirsutella minnesotensis 3608]|uniref:Uncharacterized protein n=1 Tax=Hirsutella minnesotensis 3608 TaxID=1043627 RepID=A0A0F7ZHA1_9HYPO|nr:hypothetical protein HIM_08322 [Hirsutella minnesotensis 3608]